MSRRHHRSVVSGPLGRSPPRGWGRRAESGSGSVLSAGVLFLVGVLALVSVDLMRALQARSRVQTAADAAALAAAQEIALPSGRSPAAVAAEYAERNGAALDSCDCEPGTSEAVVEVSLRVSFVLLGPDRTVRAAARAVVETAGAGAARADPAGRMTRDAGPAPIHRMARPGAS